MISLPNKPKKFNTIDSDFGTAAAKGLWYKAAQMVEYVNRSYPLGMLMYFEADQTNMPASTPDPRFWKFMDGTAVTDPKSIFYGLTLPDLRGKFLRNPVTGEVTFSSGGVSSVGLGHQHTQITGYTFNGGSQDVESEDNGDEDSPGYHAHAIGYSNGFTPSDPLAYPTTPLSKEVQVYMRVL